MIIPLCMCYRSIWHKPKSKLFFIDLNNDSDPCYTHTFIWFLVYTKNLTTFLKKRWQMSIYFIKITILMFISEAVHLDDICGVSYVQCWFGIVRCGIWLKCGVVFLGQHHSFYSFLTTNVPQVNLAWLVHLIIIQ